MPQGPTQMMVAIDYTNHRGERRWRVIVPNTISYSKSYWHQDDGDQWLLRAQDVEKKETREFPIKNIHQWMAPSVVGEDLTKMFPPPGSSE